MRTYSGLTPRSLLGGGGGGVITSYVSFMGHGVGLLSLPFGGLHQCHPGTLYPTVAWTAAWPGPQTWCKPSLAMLPLKNLCLRHNQMAAASSWVGPYHGSHARDTTWGSRTLSNWDSHSSAVVFRGGSCTSLI